MSMHRDPKTSQSLYQETGRVYQDIMNPCFPTSMGLGLLMFGGMIRYANDDSSKNA